jgi:4-azaleucine resistance transporter AzlC
VTNDARGELLRGARAAVPIAIGYVPIAIAFGILARQAGLGVLQALGMSAIVYAGASQFASLSLIAGGASPLAIALATLVLNFRHFLMSASLVQRLPARAPAGLGLGVTDETFVVAMAEERPTLKFFLGLIVPVYLSWSTGTIVGAAFSTFIPHVVARGMSVGLYAMFVAILVPGARKSWLVLLVAALGGLLTWGLAFLLPRLPYGWRIVAAIVLASAVGAAFGQPEPGGAKPGQGGAE